MTIVETDSAVPAPARDNERYFGILLMWQDGALDDTWDSFRPGDINFLFYYIQELRKRNNELLIQSGRIGEER